MEKTLTLNARYRREKKQESQSQWAITSEFASEFAIGMVTGIVKKSTGWALVLLIFVGCSEINNSDVRVHIISREYVGFWIEDTPWSMYLGPDSGLTCAEQRACKIFPK